MLQFIFGKPASGKTYNLINKIKELADVGKQSILIVPEQFTFESERTILRALGDSASLNTSVLSFSRICEEVGRFAGGIAGITLGDADKVIFMNRALKDVASELRLWSKYSNSISFSKAMLDAVGEFKINSVSVEEIRTAAMASKSRILSNKLEDIALIYERYDALVGEKFIDPADSLTKLYHTLADYRFFEGKTVFFDSFKGFTGQQFKIIKRIISQADDVYVALTYDPDNRKEYGIFTNIKAAAERIEKIAKAYGVAVSPPINLGESRYNNKSLSSLEGLISGGEVKKSEGDSGIIVCHSATEFDEAEFAARTIRRLVRTKGYRYRDFVIIARDAEQYIEAVNSACKRNGVNFFYDNRVPLSGFPLAAAVEAVIGAINYSTESILRFNKTGLGTLETDEISQLENYTYLWNITGEQWLNDWNMDPRGFISGDSEDLKLRNALEELNILRKKAIEPIRSFKTSFFGNAAQMATAVIDLFKNCNVSEKLVNMSERFVNLNNSMSSEVLKQSYSEYIKILDSLVRCFGNKTLKREEFCDALKLAVTLASVGVIPQMLDEVTFGAADRIRPSRPKIAFILGLNQGVFPKFTSNSGIFSTVERKALIESGIDIADNSVFSSIDEEYLVYCNLCCASEQIYISYSRQSVIGEEKEPSAILRLILSNLKCYEVFEPQEKLDLDSLPETADATISQFCRRIRTDIDDAATLRLALNNTVGDRLSIIENSISEREISISEKTAQKLFGNEINMSASKFDTFNRCRFSFFCRYGLSAKKLQPAEFDVMQRGTIVHYVLERLIVEHKEGIKTLSVSELDRLTDSYINEYLNSIVGYRSIENARLEFLVSRLSRSLKEVVRHIAAELSQSLFVPIACELKIGKGCEISPPAFAFENGEIILNGIIDRVDEYNGYIRIIDYKTGSKSFKLPDILFGLNLQMLIYLYAVIRGNGLDDIKAAGLLYQPSKRDTTDKGMAMNGLLQCDPELVSAMEKSGQGEFIPKLHFNKDGSLSKRSSSFISANDFTEIFNYIERLMKKTGNTLLKGDIAVSPLDGRESPACKYCDFSSVCGIENQEIPRVPELDNTEVIKIIKEGMADGI